MTNRLAAGVGRADITPPVGIAHVNWGARTHDRAEGVDMPFWATVLLLDDGESKAAIVDLDFLLIPTVDCRALRARVAEAAGVAPEHVRISCTHTHSGAPWSADRMGGQKELPGMDLVPAFRARLDAAIVEAARVARAAQRPARVAAGYGSSDVSVNRRLRLPEGRTVVAQNWDGETDPTLTVLRIDDLEERPIACVVGYGTHPIVLAHQNRQLSPDYPGTLKRRVEALVGGHCLFLQGCAGDQIPREALTGDLGAARRMGELIAIDAARVALRLRTARVARRFDHVVESGAPLGIWAEDREAGEAPTIAVASRTVELPVRDYGPADALAAEAEKRHAIVRDLDKSTATAEAIAAANYQSKRAAMNAHWARICAERRSFAVEMQAIRIGDAALIGVPLEPFCRIGIKVREGSPFKVTQFAGYTNGWDGYVPTEDAYAFGGYETEWATPYAPQAAEFLIGEAGELLTELARR
jgi:hypothetical protein